MDIAIFWHRRDLRLEDNAGLYHALRSGYPVLPLFVFDREILDELEDRADRRVEFIHKHVGLVSEELREYGSSLLVRYGKPVEVFKELLEKYDIKEVYANRDYEPYAKQRDKQIADLLQTYDATLKLYKDQCLFERDEVVKNDGKPYTVFTPYGKKWRKTVNEHTFASYPVEEHLESFYKTDPLPVVSLEEMGFRPVGEEFPPRIVTDKLLEQYGDKRNFPAVKGTSRLSVHLRFGTVSVRSLARRGQEKSDVWLNELIWRDFYMQILDHFPHVAERSFREKYDRIEWRNDEVEFEAWKEGRTGYPIVDAGMRELNQTGFMHNRVRMIVASFLTKHLLIDWRWGERYFARKLLDFELSSNNGGWQWAAGSGTDAAPYFRVFNPSSQVKKFDENLQYIRRWAPDFQNLDYPKPIVEHKFARERALAAYKSGLAQ